MAVFIAVVFNRAGKGSQYREASEKAMNLRSIAEKASGSSYELDCRQTAG